MGNSDRDRQFMTLVTEYRSVAESGFRHLAEKVDALERKIDALGCVEGPLVPLLKKIEDIVVRIDGRFEAGEEPEGIATDMKKLIAKIERLSKNVAVLENIVAKGAQLQFPWFHIKGDKNGHKGKAVEKVWRYLKEHEESGRTEAVDKTYRKDPLGYKTRDALLSECRRLKVEKYRWC